MTLAEYNEKYWKDIHGHWSPCQQQLINGWICLLRFFTVHTDSDCFKDMCNFLDDYDSMTPEEQEECTENYDIKTYLRPLVRRLQS